MDIIIRSINRHGEWCYQRFMYHTRTCAAIVARHTHVYILQVDKVPRAVLYDFLYNAGNRGEKGEGNKHCWRKRVTNGL